MTSVIKNAPPPFAGAFHRQGRGSIFRATPICPATLSLKVVISIEDENFQTVYYFLCMEKDREKLGQLIERFQGKHFRTE